jgi:hypothetical protein
VGLAAKPVSIAWLVSQVGRQNLYRDIAIYGCVMRLEHLAHATFGDQSEQLVSPEVRCVQPITFRTAYRAPPRLGPPLSAPSTNTDRGKILTYSVASRAVNALTGFTAPGVRQLPHHFTALGVATRSPRTGLHKRKRVPGEPNAVSVTPSGSASQCPHSCGHDGVSVGRRQSSVPDRHPVHRRSEDKIQRHLGVDVWI